MLVAHKVASLGLEEQGITGYDTQPLLINKTREPAQSLRQIFPATVARPALAEELAETERFAKHVCPNCSEVWYDYYVRGMLPLRRDALAPNVGFQFTHEWFGNGRTARREMLVSRRVASLVSERGWKGLYLAPVQLV